jgi:hypothetical protein
MDNNQNNVRQPGASIRLSTVATSTRQTPKTDFGTVMRDGLVRAGNVAVDGLRVAAPFVPGGAIVSAALAGGAQIAGDVDTRAYQGVSYGAGAGAGARGGGVYGSHVAGLTGGGGPAASSSANPGSYNATGTLALPGARPGLNTDLNSNATTFSPGSTATAGASDAFNQMMSATRQMAEFQASFNLQYLQLQEKIQIDSRQFNLVSNIMKTKHDAAKNALNNVR